MWKTSNLFKGNGLSKSGAITGIAVFAIMAGAAFAEDWPIHRGPNHDGISTETGLDLAWGREGPKKLWEASLGTGFSSLVVAGGRVYSMGNKGDRDTVWCLNADTGAVVWQYGYRCRLDPKMYEGGPSATPTVDGDRVYSFSKEGHIFCLNSADGKVVWAKHAQKDFGMTPPKWGFAGSPLVAGNAVIINAGTSGLALDKATGATIWKSGTGVSGYATPMPYAIGDREGVLIFAASSLVAVDPALGTSQWSFPCRNRWQVNASSPILLEDGVFISSGYGKGSWRVRLANGRAESAWHNKSLRMRFTSGVAANGHVFGSDEKNGELIAIDLASGRTSWARKGLNNSQVTLADGKLIVLTEGGELIVAEASPDTWKELARAQILARKCWTAPVVSGGRIYARNAKGDAVALAVK